jgi:hypothetical protein
MGATYGLGDQPRWEYRDVIGLLYDHGWHDAEKVVEMACTVDAESGCFPHAWHWNDPQDGGDGSTDWGMFQLNDGNKGGQPPSVLTDGLPVATTQFQKDALDPATAVVKARELYNARGFQPWFGHAKWKNYAPAMTRALANYFRNLWGIPLL